MEQKLYDAAAKLPETSLDYHTIQPTTKSKTNRNAWKTVVSLATCFALLISIGFITVEAKEYSDAIAFFDEYGLSTEGLSRDDIKAVYKDITTKSFTYAKTAEVIADSLSVDQVGGYEILQDHPTAEDVENLWNYKNYHGVFLKPGQQGIHYTYRSEYKKYDHLDYSVLDKSYLEKYDGDTLLWSASVSEFWINGYSIVSDGVIAYGKTSTWSGAQQSRPWMAKIDANGNLLWKRMLDNGFKDEYIAEIVENEDGSYAVFSRVDLKQLCLSQYTNDGKEADCKKIEIGNYGIWNAAGFDGGYIVQLGSHMSKEYSKIAKIDRDGNMTESFSYSSEDAHYYITDMIEYNGNIYLSAYAVPKREDAGGRDEIAGVLNYLFNNGIWEISSEELTPMVRDNYTAMLLVCDPAGGRPQEFYSVKGSLGSKLSLGEDGMLLWDVESITSTFFSPATSAFTIGGVCYVFRYTFNPTGKLFRQEKTGEIVSYHR